jgi:hypothetical protein
MRTLGWRDCARNASRQMSAFPLAEWQSDSSTHMWGEAVSAQPWARLHLQTRAPQSSGSRRGGAEPPPLTCRSLRGVDVARHGYLLDEVLVAAPAGAVSAAHACRGRVGAGVLVRVVDRGARVAACERTRVGVPVDVVPRAGCTRRAVTACATRRHPHRRCRSATSRAPSCRAACRTRAAPVRSARAAPRRKGEPCRTGRRGTRRRRCPGRRSWRRCSRS